MSSAGLYEKIPDNDGTIYKCVSKVLRGTPERTPEKYVCGKNKGGGMQQIEALKKLEREAEKIFNLAEDYCDKHRDCPLARAILFQCRRIYEEIEAVAAKRNKK